MSTTTHSGLVRHIGAGQGTALYAGAILGAGVLVLPGQVATIAGPASLVSWAVACAMGAPLAWMFACLARLLPHAGGVATYVGSAWGDTLGGVTGWLYFVAGSVGQTIVPLTGGYYVARVLHAGDGTAYAVAGVILAVAVVANLVGAKVGSRAQLGLAVVIAVTLVVTIVVSVPEMDTARLTPFAPHGLQPVGAAVVTLFFAFAGWEAVAHLAEEFSDPERDLPRAVLSTIALVTVLYLGLASAVVLTGTYGNSRIDHVAVGRLLQHSLGSGSDIAAAVIAILVSLGTTNAFVAGVSRLAYSLAKDRWLPAPVARLSRHAVPVGGVLTVAAVAVVGLVLGLARNWGTETLVVVPSTLVVAVYLLAAAAGVRLLRGLGRVCAVATIALTALVVPAALGHAVIPVVVAVVALGFRYVLSREARTSSSQCGR